jgi:N-acylneuraminate cytidylyltransferase
LEIPEAQAFSIDDEYEFRLIEALVGAGLITLPWLDARDATVAEAG